MKVLLDQNLPPRACERLRAEGIDAVHTEERVLSTAADEDILAWCAAEARVLVSRDADFHEILARSGASGLRVEGLDDAAVAARVAAIVRDFAKDLQSGVAVSVSADSIRIHRLPLAAREGE